MNLSPSIDSARSSVLGADKVVLTLLARTLGSDRSLRVALFTFDEAAGTYSISAVAGFSAPAVEIGRRVLVFRTGDDRGMVGLVAERRQPCYVPDCLAEPRWIGRDGTVRSCYLAPLVDGERVPHVLCVASPNVAGLSLELRALVDWLVDFARQAHAFEVSLRAHLGRLEHRMRDVAIEWDGVRSHLGADIPAGIRGQLKLLSAREWEIVACLQRGQRVATIARQLGISVNTVRNHAKSINRKLGIRSQSELRERIGSLRLGPDVPPSGRYQLSCDVPDRNVGILDPE